jgi:hypothetical protein
VKLDEAAECQKPVVTIVRIPPEAGPTMRQVLEVVMPEVAV